MFVQRVFGHAVARPWMLVRPALRRPVFAVLALAMVFGMGCGKKDNSEIPVAQVDDVVIDLGYYQRKMNTMFDAHLPENIDTHDGRMELLETMINKEVMALKAAEFGMDSDGEANQAADAWAALQAVKEMKADLVKPLLDVSEEEIQDYYENFGRNLRISYMAFDTIEEAEEARHLVLGGEDWVTVATRTSFADPGPNGNYTMGFKYGTVTDDLEVEVFALSPRDITEPVESIYGFFIIRLDGQVMEKVPPLDTIRESVIESVIGQKKNLRTLDFIKEVFAEYNFYLNEEALIALFDALPPDLPLVPPPPRDEQASLNMHPSLMDMVLMSYADDVWTMRRYYDFFEETGWMARPRRDKRIGFLRRHLKEVALREVLPTVAEDRGYFDSPGVKDARKERREQAMVGRLHEQLIQADVKVSNADIDTFWASHKEEFNTPELRSGVVVVCETEQKALAASLAAKSQDDWGLIVSEYGLEGKQPEKGAEIPPARAAHSEPIPRLLYLVDTVGDISYPSRLPDNTWAVVRLDEIKPPEAQELVDVGTRVKSILEQRMAEEIFQERLAEWKAGMSIRRYPKNVDKAVLDRGGDEADAPDLELDLPNPDLSSS